MTLPRFRLCYGFEKTFYDSLLRIKNAGMTSKFHCPEHYDKPRKARKMEAVASTFLRVLSSLGRGILMPSLHFLFKLGLREVFSNPFRQVMRWQLVFIKLRLTDCAGFLNCQGTAQRIGTVEKVTELPIPRLCHKDFKPDLDNVDLQILRLSFTI